MGATVVHIYRYLFQHVKKSGLETSNAKVTNSLTVLTQRKFSKSSSSPVAREGQASNKLNTLVLESQSLQQ